MQKNQNKKGQKTDLFLKVKCITKCSALPFYFAQMHQKLISDNFNRFEIYFQILKVHLEKKKTCLCFLQIK